MVMKSKRQLLIFPVSLIFCINTFLCIWISNGYEIERFAWISICQLIVHCIFVSCYCKQKIFILLFICFSWAFHCGQIAVCAFDLKGELFLPFYNYGTQEDIYKAFIFYFGSQIFLTVGCIVGNNKSGKKKRSELTNIDLRSLALMLIVIGGIPRLYIDMSRLMLGLSSGYKAVYSFKTTSVSNSIAFMCDAGLILLLINSAKRKNCSGIYWFILVYKLIVILSGARQEAFCFLIVWTVIYFWYIKKIKAIQKTLIAILSIVAVAFIDFVGTVRTDGFSFALIANSFSLVNNSLIGDTLGEFGCAFSSLVVAINGYPRLYSFGYGKSYLAAILSAVPKLVSAFPWLLESTTFTTMFSNTFSFGGSYLGEFYYNFSWGGIIALYIVGYVIGRCQAAFERNDNTLDICWKAVILIKMILFVRGYISDMAQSCIWLWIVIKLYKQFVLYNRKLNITIRKGKYE